MSASVISNEVYPVLTRGRIWNCFALADLEPPLRVYSQFALASRGTRHALCLVLRYPVTGEVISPFGEEEGIAALLQPYYRPETAANWRRMLRMGDFHLLVSS
jgi:hypothetical protein